MIMNLQTVLKYPNLNTFQKKLLNFGIQRDNIMEWKMERNSIIL